MYNIVNDCVLVDTQKIREKQSSVFVNEVKLQESATVVNVKAFPFSSAAQKIDVEMNEQRALNNVSEFKTPTYTSPEKNEVMESSVKSVLPDLKITQFLE